jgi:dynein heavy chain
MKKLEEKVLNQPEFTSAAVDRGNYATKFLYMWVKAMTDYYNVFTKTKPLRDRKIEMTKLAEEKALELKIKKMELEQVKQRIQELEELFEEKNRQKDELTTKITECQIKLERA